MIRIKKRYLCSLFRNGWWVDGRVKKKWDSERLFEEGLVFLTNEGLKKKKKEQ